MNKNQQLEILNTNAKPFLKWAGGKGQLLNQIRPNLPPLDKVRNLIYVEPFIGSGAVMFWMAENYANLSKIVINDANEELVNVYRQIGESVDTLIDVLKGYQSEYDLRSNDQHSLQDYYLERREEYNKRVGDAVTQAALFIFLNRTCFNGLYRVNSKNNFNVPMGKYKNPQICDETNLRRVAELMKKVEVHSGDYSQTLMFATANSFFYLDPPYRPLNETSSFRAYCKEGFGDREQINLKGFCDALSAREVKWLLSNSNPLQTENTDRFFHELYEDYSISTVEARRSINSKSDKRGVITELLIKNY
jgi:DNA adenine methylase